MAIKVLVLLTLTEKHNGQTAEEIQMNVMLSS